ncbi:hypothetical protein EJ08DRAFT_584957 [Tothia fuscella]|uniref:CENP-V/GFA domain-containing protein n=1 Tax=Tothia fuscella TaxID=1048955 RepID=A0A9P4TZQ1_9PEZI|nr:hypothetical protein EJ08DRAFT_584957 [Tothia fuscella]
MADEKTIISSSCHCGSSNYSFEVSTSTLPIQQLLCHCDNSRRISGCLFTSYVPVPLDNPAPKLESLTAYHSSDILTRWFCGSCGTHMYLEYKHDGHFEVSHGSVKDSEGVLEFMGHMWIGDTKDGGASDWMPTFGGKAAKRWLGEPENSDEAPLKWKEQDTAASTASRGDKLRAHCHCGGVEFFISEPNEESLKASSPLPDLLVPYNSGRSAENPDNKPWWLSEDRSKHLAGTCACNSCRQISGFDITPWTFVPVGSLTLANNEPFHHGFGTLKSYRSSPIAKRWFCDTCGANVFYDSDERPTLLDISVGLLDAESGARAEEWLEWEKGRVSFRDDAHNNSLINTLQEGLEKWEQQG